MGSHDHIRCEWMSEAWNDPECPSRPDRGDDALDHMIIWNSLYSRTGLEYVDDFLRIRVEISNFHYIMVSDPAGGRQRLQFGQAQRGDRCHPQEHTLFPGTKNGWILPRGAR